MTKQRAARSIIINGRQIERQPAPICFDALPIMLKCSLAGSQRSCNNAVPSR